MNQDHHSVTMCGRVRWLTDKISKNYLVACWRIRQVAMGRPRMVNGQLRHTRARVGNLTVTELLEQQSEPLQPPHARCMRTPLTRWLPKPKAQPKTGTHQARVAFYIVFFGRTTGLFYKWTDCLRSIKGYPNASVKGYRTLPAAMAAWNEHCLQLPANWLGDSSNFV